MTAKRKKARLMPSADELVTSRLMCGFLYTLLYAFLLFVISGSIQEEFGALSGVFFLLALALCLVSLIFCLLPERGKSRKKRVHNAAFGLVVSGCLAVSFLCIWLLGPSGFAAGALVGAVACALYFVYIVYRRWIFLLSVFAPFLAGLVCLTQIPFFSARTVYRALFSLFLALLALSFLFLVRHLQERDEREGPFQHLRFSAFVSLYLLFLLALLGAVLLPEFCVGFALVCPLYSLLYLVLFGLVRRK